MTIGGTVFLYAGFSQFGVQAVGTYAYLSPEAPYLDEDDAHTLAEVAASSADGRQIVEVGWTVDRGVNGDTAPHVFVFHWVNGDAKCYNACGYHQVSTKAHPGDVVNASLGPQKYAIEYFEGNWWVGVGDVWMGYFAGSDWTNPAFAELGGAQWFGEVAAATGSPCTDMGKGIFGTAAGAATIGQPAFIRADNTAAPAQPNNYGDAPLYASDGATGGYGGPGACAGTWITAAPRDPTNDSTPRFNFESEDPAATFECAIDSAFAPCSGPGRSAAPSTALADGPHVFTVRARNQAGARDPTPASTAFTVDTVPPDTIIDYQPPPVGRDPWAAVEFHSEDVAGFECRLDAEPFDTCTSPWSLEGVGDGRHSVEVRATDEAGNVQPVPARASFSIDTRRPVLDVRAPRRSGVGRGWTSIRARCSEACRLSSSPAVLLYLHRTRVKLRIQGATTRRVEAGRWNSLRMRLGRAQRARVKRVMASGGRAIMVANLTATDRAGNRSIRAVRVLLRR